MTVPLLDETDLAILKILQEDAYTTTKELASQLELTTSPVHERVKRLKAKGYIRRYVALLDRNKLNYQLLAFSNVQLKEHAAVYLEKFEKDVQSLPEVQEVYHIAGQYDYLLKVVTTDMKAYQAFVSEKLAALDNIGRVQSSFVMKEIKHTTSLPL